MLRYETLERSAGAKKFVSATAVADKGDNQALFLPGTTPFRLGIAVAACALHNRSGGTVQVGLAVRLPAAIWEGGAVTAAGAYTADTADLQDEDTGDFTIHDRADSGSGLLVGADIPFNIVGVVQSAAGDQTTPVLVIEYWNGSAWTDITASAFISDNLGGATGEHVIAFPIPSDWAKGGSGTGVPASRYNLRLRTTQSGAGTTNPLGSQVFLGVAILQVEAVGDNVVADLIRDHEYLFPPQGDALFPVFSTANRGNLVRADVRLAG